MLIACTLFAQTGIATAYTFTQQMEQGDQNAEVSALQKLLSELDHFNYPVITGYFGPVTEAAVQAFQAKYGVVSSGTPYTTGYGRVGPLTLIALNTLHGAFSEPVGVSISEPASFELSVSEKESTHITLEWEYTQGATYTLERKGEQGTYATLADNLTTDTYTDTEVLRGHTYTYRTTSAGTYSNEVSVKVPNPGTTSGGSASIIPDTTAPALPTGLAVDAGDATATITWTDPADSDLAYLTLYRGTTTGNLTLLATTTLGTETYTDVPLANDTTYFYTVSATDGSGNESDQTTEVSDTPTGVYDIYVDSENGDDDNDGTSAYEAFVTIAALESHGITDGMRIGLAKDSHWREQLDITADNVLIEAYGDGEKPLLDASDIIDSSEWTKTVGQTNVYEAELSFVDADGEGVMRIWEDGEMLSLVADVAAVDATPGSYYTASHTASPATVYIHTGDSTNPQTSEKVYEYPNREHGLAAAVENNNTTVTGIWTRRQQHSDGSMVLRKFATVEDVRVDEGTVHALMIGEGSDVNTVSINGWSPINAASQIILYTGSATEQDTTIANVTLEGIRAPQSYSGSGSPFGAHANGGSKLGNISVSNITANNIGSASVNAGDLGNGKSLTVTNLTVTNTLTGIGVGSSGKHIYRDISIDSSLINTYGWFRLARGIDVEIYDSSYTMTDTARTAVLSYTQGTGTSTVLLSNIELDHVGTAYGVGLQLNSHSSVDLTVGSTTFDLTSTSDSRNTYIQLPATYVLDSNNNTFVEPLRKFIIDGVNKTLAEWRDETGQDLNSIPLPQDGF